MTARWRPIGKHCDARRTMSDRTTTWALPAKVGLSDRRSTDACIRKISALSSPRDPKTSRNADTSQPDNQTFATFGAMLSSTYSRTPSKPHAVSVRLKLDDWTCLLQSRRDDAGESAPGLRFFATSPPSVQNPEIVHSFAQRAGVGRNELRDVGPIGGRLAGRDAGMGGRFLRFEANFV